MLLNTIRSAVDFATHLPRYREILYILYKYGFANELRLAALAHLLSVTPEERPTHKEGILAQPLPVRVRLALEELGTTFIKFGQIISSRRDLVNDEFYAELVKLQAQVPVFSTSMAEEIIVSELHTSPAKIFREFDEIPIGSASIAQVHFAVLQNGSKVAVKVQRPDIVKTITIDLAIAQDIAGFVARHVPEISGLNPEGVMKEFAISMMKELDFTIEAKNSERFATQFEGNDRIRIPQIFWELSTEKVLTMEFMTGIPVDDVIALQQNDIDPVILSESLTELIFQQIFEHGFFHGDPHPGNMTVQPDGAIGLYDYGMMGTFTPEFRLSVARMISGLAQRSHKTVMRSILEMSEEGYPNDPQKMLADVELFADEHLNKPLKDIDLGFVLNKLLELLRNNHLRMRGSFYLGIKALTQVEAIGRVLNPDLNFVKLGAPYALRIIVGKYKPQHLFSLFQHLLADSVDFLEEFPHDFRTFYQRLKRGDVNFPLEHKIDPEGFEPLRKTLDSIANRLTNAILAASILVCSSILVLAHIPPTVFGIPAIGGAGVLFGAIMCMRLVISIWKHGGL